MKLLFLILWVGTTSVAETSSGRIRILTATDLSTNLSQFRIVDSRELAEFRRGHLPGSVRMEWKDWTLERPSLWNAWFGDASKWGAVDADPHDLELRLSALGLSNELPMVVVGTPHAWGEEGRIAWNLLYWGADDVALLDGGYPAWAADRARPTETGIGNSKSRAGNFKVKIRDQRRALLADVKAATQKKDRPILDARATDEFLGKTMSGQKRGGRLPGATSIPVASLYRANGEYLSARELESKIALAPSSRPIAYCVGGVRSALLALLLEVRLGVLTANYDASLWEWSARDDLPLEK